MIEGEDDASSGPKRNGRHFLGRLYQLRGWPPGWHSWTSELDDMLMTDILFKYIGQTQPDSGPSVISVGTGNMSQFCIFK